MTPDSEAEVLAIHPGALGDVLLAVPAIRALRRGHGSGRVVLGAQPRIGALLEDLGALDGHVAVEGLGLEALFVEDRSLRPSARVRDAAEVVCWFGSGDPLFVRRLGEIAPRSVVASPSGTNGVPVWEHLVGTVQGPAAPGGLSGPHAGPASREALAVPADLVEAGRAMLLGEGWDGGTPVLVLHPGAGGEAKRWAAAAFAAVAAELASERGLVVVIHAGPADHAAADEVRHHLAARPGNARPPMVLVEPGLGALAGALTRAHLYLGNDSGVSHLAAAVGAPAVVLFMRANLRWVPWSATARPIVVSPAGPASERHAVLRACRTLLDPIP